MAVKDDPYTFGSETLVLHGELPCSGTVTECSYFLQATQIDDEDDPYTCGSETLVWPGDLPHSATVIERSYALQATQIDDETLDTNAGCPHPVDNVGAASGDFPELEAWAESTLREGGLEHALSQVMEEALLAERDRRATQMRDAAAPPEETPLTLSLAPRGTMAAPSCWERFWAQLASRGWQVERTPRGDAYYLPPGVARGPGAQCRVHYFDSKLQVLRYWRDHGAVVVEVPMEDGEDSAVRWLPSMPQQSGDAYSVAATPASWKKSVRAYAEPTVAGRHCGSLRNQSAAALQEKRRCGRGIHGGRGRGKGNPSSHGDGRGGQNWQSLAEESWEKLWAVLSAHGWSLERGPRGDPYYLPRGVRRGPGAKNRVDYFDAQTQVRAHVARCGVAMAAGRSGNRGSASDGKMGAQKRNEVLKRPAAAVMKS